MNKHEPSAKLSELSVAERLQLMEDIWASLSDEPDKVVAPSWHLTELDVRIAEQERNPPATRPWPEVRAEILRSLRKV